VATATDLPTLARAGFDRLMFDTCRRDVRRQSVTAARTTDAGT